MIHFFCEFTTVVQLAATFNLGCIALSGIGNFAKSLSDYFFKVQEHFNETLFKMRRLIKTDIESLKNFSPCVIEGHNYEAEIKQLESKFVSLKNETENDFKVIEENINANYIPKYLDSICLLLGIYSICELVFASFIKIKMESFVLSFYTLNTIISLLTLFYIVYEFVNFMVVFHGKQELSQYRIKESKTAIVLAFLALLISFFFPIFNTFFVPIIPCTKNIATIHFYLGLLLPFTGFIVYWIYIQILSEKAKSYINTKLQPLQEKFNILHNRKHQIDIILTEFNNTKISVN